LVRAGAQPYLGARIVSGDEMIDGVLFPRVLRPLGLWRPTSAEGVGGGSIAGAGRKGIGLMMGERAVITSGGSVDDLCSRRLAWGECVVAEFAQEWWARRQSLRATERQARLWSIRLATSR
jgi:hypothetical protein